MTMIPEERLTAYALNDPGLSSDERAAIEADPQAMAIVAETRRVAEVLAKSLIAEQPAVPHEPPVTVPSQLAKPPQRRSWTMYAVAASLLLAVGASYFAMAPGIGRVREYSSKTAAELRAREALAEEAVALSPRGDTLASTPAAPAPADSSSAKHAKQDHLFESLDRPTVALSDRNQVAPSTPTPPPAKPASSAPAPSGPSVGSGPGGSSGNGWYARDEAAGLSGAGSKSAPTAGGGVLGDPHNGLARTTEDRFGATPAPADEPGAMRSKQSARGLSSKVEQPKKRLEQMKQLQASPQPDRYQRPPSTLVENSFIKVAGQSALSTFGVDVDTASYSIVRRYLTQDQLPPPDAVRLEELVNYFPYQDKPPTGDDPYAVTVEMATCPWNTQHRLARIGVKAKPIDNSKRPPSNLVFLIDVSGSMSGPDRLPLVKASMKMLVNQLGENDRVAMVVYAGASGLVLDSTSAVNKGRIIEALDKLEAGGSTNGAGGLQQAYDVAVNNFIKGGTNRVILCTDGDWNVGTTSTEALVSLIEEKRKTGVFLSVFGFGMGNLRDEMMVKLAGKGNGNYGYIDNLKEAYKSLVEQLGGTLVTVAKDVKIQVEFNPAAIREYRLLGYEKRTLAARDFADDKKDAGEMGAGHVVTALYELVPVDVPVDAAPQGEELRYQPKKAEAVAAPVAKAEEAFIVKMRHKKPDADVSTLREMPIKNEAKTFAQASEDFRFAASVASFAMLLRESPYRGQSTLKGVLDLAESARGYDPGAYRAEFIELVRRTKQLTGQP